MSVVARLAGMVLEEVVEITRRIFQLKNCVHRECESHGHESHVCQRNVLLHSHAVDRELHEICDFSEQFSRFSIIIKRTATYMYRLNPI